MTVIAEEDNTNDQEDIDNIDNELTEDEMYFERTNYEVKNEVISMCNLSDGIEQKTILQSIQNLMENLKLSMEQAMVALEVPETDREKYVKMIKLQNK